MISFILFTKFIVIYFELALPRKCQPSVTSYPVSGDFVNSELF